MPQSSAVKERIREKMRQLPITVSSRADPAEIARPPELELHRTQVIWMVVSENDPFQPGQVDAGILRLPDGVGAEIDHRIVVDRIGARRRISFPPSIFACLHNSHSHQTPEFLPPPRYQEK